MNCQALTKLAPASPPRTNRRFFRTPANMHVPKQHVALRFSLEPEWSWVVRSMGNRRGGTPVPQWIRDADAA